MKVWWFLFEGIHSCHCCIWDLGCFLISFCWEEYVGSFLPNFYWKIWIDSVDSTFGVEQLLLLALSWLLISIAILLFFFFFWIELNWIREKNLLAIVKGLGDWCFRGFWWVSLGFVFFVIFPCWEELEVTWFFFTLKSVLWSSVERFWKWGVFVLTSFLWFWSGNLALLGYSRLIYHNYI